MKHTLKILIPILLILALLEIVLLNGAAAV